MTSQNLAHLRAIVGDMERQPAPGKLLVGGEVRDWAAAFAFSRAAPSGERVGIRRNGVAAALKLAKALAKAEPRLHRGAQPRKLTEAILNAAIKHFESRTAASLTAADYSTLVTAISDWFTDSVMPRTYIVPCAIMPDMTGFPNAVPFTVGPVAFSHIADFLKQKGIGNLKDNPMHEINYGPLVQAMNERSATWVAQVQIDGCEKTRAAEIADLAVDVALVGVQLVIPRDYSRTMARITGRTAPPFIGSVYIAGSDTYPELRWCYPGYGLSGGAFDELRSNQASLVQSVGNRIDAYVRGVARVPNLEQAWCDAAYWFHEGLAEPLDTIAVAKLETAIEVLLGAESTKLSKTRLLEAIQAFYGLEAGDPLASDPSVSIKQFVEGIVGARSRVLHGTFSTLTENVEVTRASVELLSFDFLRLSSLSLDRYSTAVAPADTAKAFLSWIDQERRASKPPSTPSAAPSGS